MMYETKIGLLDFNIIDKNIYQLIILPPDIQYVIVS